MTSNQEITMLKQNIRNLESEIAERVRNYLIQHQKHFSLQSSLKETHLFRQGHCQTIFKEKKVNCNKKGQISEIISLRTDKPSAWSLKRIINLEIRGSTVGKELSEQESECIITQEDSENLQDYSKIKLAIPNQRSLDIIGLTKKLQEANDSLTKYIELQNKLLSSISSFKSNSDIFQFSARNHKQNKNDQNADQTVQLILSLIYTLESSLRQQKAAHRSQHEMRIFYEQQNITLKQQCRHWQQRWIECNKLRQQEQKTVQKLHQRLIQKSVLIEEYLKAYSKQREQKQKISQILQNQRKFESYSTHQSIIQNELEYRTSSRISQKYQDSQPYEDTSIILQTIQQMLKLYRQRDHLKAQPDKIIRSLQFQQFKYHAKKLQKLITNYKNYQSLGKVDSEGEQLQQIHSFYQKLIKDMIQSFQEKVKSFQCKFNEVMTKMILSSSACLSSKSGSIKLFSEKGIVESSLEPFLNDVYIKQINDINSSSEQMLYKDSNNFKESQKVLKLQETCRKLSKMHQDQVQLMKQRQDRLMHEFQDFMRTTVQNCNRSFPQLKMANEKVDWLIKKVGTVLFQIMQCLPLRTNEDTLFLPESKQQLLSVLEELRSFGRKYQQQQKTQVQERLQLQQAIFSVFEKFIKQYNIPRQYVLKQQEHLNLMPHLMNLLHRHYNLCNPQDTPHFFLDVTHSDSLSIKPY